MGQSLAFQEVEQVLLVTKPVKASRCVSTWSRKHRWNERAAAWDRHIDQFVCERNREKILGMRMQHAATAKLYNRRALNGIRRRLLDFPADPNTPRTFYRSLFAWLISTCAG